MGMRRVISLCVLAVLASLACAAVAWSAGQHKVSPSHAKLERNKRAARADAVHMLKSLRMPPGTVRTRAIKEHHGSGALEAVLTDFIARAEYRTPDGVNAYRYIKRHRPRDSKVSGSGGAYRILKNGQRRLIYRDFELAFPGRRGVVFARLLRVQVRKLKSGRSIVSVTAQSNWIIPRPSAEKVPSAVTQVAVSGATIRRHSGTAWANSPISSKTEVAKLIKLVDRPGITQDETINCPAEGLYPQHTLSLEFQNAEGKTLASVEADWSGNDGNGATGWECSPLDFKLGKKHEPSLQDPRFLKQFQKLTGINPEA
jgi:hypothetical protein